MGRGRRRPGSGQKGRSPRRKDRPEVFASQVMNQWAGGLRAFQRNEVALAVLGLSAATVGPIIDEMLVGANRLGLQERIAEAAREETRAVGTRWSSVADRVTGIAANTINDFVAYLDYAALPVDQRPGVPEPPKERKRGIFTTASLKHPGPVLGDEPEEIEKAFFLDWGVALRAFGCDNVGHAAGREISDEKNRELGAILDMIDVSWLVAAE
nr:virulence factor SrfC family protein [Rhodospirillum rubrum]